MRDGILFDGKSDLEEWLALVALQGGESFPEPTGSGKEINYGNWHASNSPLVRSRRLGARRSPGQIRGGWGLYGGNCREGHCWAWLEILTDNGNTATSSIKTGIKTGGRP